jgi:hypothetical protein
MTRNGGIMSEELREETANSYENALVTVTRVTHKKQQRNLMQQPIDSTEQYTGCGRETLYLGKYTV